MALYSRLNICNIRGSTLLCKTNILNNCPSLNEVSKRCLFWEKERKAGYDPKDKVSTFMHIRNGMKELKTEFKLLSQEIKEHVSHPVLFARPGM